MLWHHLQLHSTVTISSHFTTHAIAPYQCTLTDVVALLQKAARTSIRRNPSCVVRSAVIRYWTCVPATFLSSSTTTALTGNALLAAMWRHFRTTIDHCRNKRRIATVVIFCHKPRLQCGHKNKYKIPAEGRMLKVDHHSLLLKAFLINCLWRLVP